MTVDAPGAAPQHSIVLDAAWLLTVAAASTPLVLNLAPGGGLATGERCLAAVLVGLAAWRPLEALLVLAALAPLGTVVSGLAGWERSATLVALSAVLVGGAGAFVSGRLRVDRARPALLWAVLLLSWLALASVVVQVLRDRLLFETAEEWRRAVAASFGWGDYAGIGSWRTAVRGVSLAQQVLVLPMVVAAVPAPAETRSLAAMALAGVTGAAVMNVLRAITVALRSGLGWAGLAAVVHGQRLSAAFPDFNSAGSLFALAAVTTGAFLVETGRVRRWSSAAVWAGCLLAQSAALWLTGSRVALGSVAAATLAVLVLSGRGQRVTGRRLAVLSLVVLTSLLLLAASQARRHFNDAPLALHVRIEFVKTTWAMLRDHPVWGVGAGSYPEASARYATNALRQYYRRENAHNNFLQVAGELGPVALAALLVLLVVPLWDVGRRLRRGAVPSVAAGIWCGILALLLTCTAGHPLLISEVAVCFFLLLGGLWSVSTDVVAAQDRWPGRTALLLAATVAVLAGSIPVRVQAARAGLELEHVLLSGQRWVKQDGVPTVVFRDHVSVYVVGDDRRSRLTFYVGPDRGGPVELTLRLDGRVANVVRLEDAAWVPVSLLVPRSESGRFRILRVDARYVNGVTALPTVSLRRVEHDAGATAGVAEGTDTR